MPRSTQARPIGGYIELELGPAHADRYPGAIGFQSARAGFVALLESARPRRVLVPRYICDAMLLPLTTIGVEFHFYDLDTQLEPERSVALSQGDWLLYPNYFGLCDVQAERLLARFPPDQIVLDHSQAYFSPPKKCLATLYSPRKFFGMADGGLLVSSSPVARPVDIDVESPRRYACRLMRHDLPPEDGYSDYRWAEATLCDARPRRMSNLSRRLLSNIDQDLSRRRRNSNFSFLHERLGHMNGLPFDPAAVDGPLCYPLLTSYPSLRDFLRDRRVFVPTFWQEVLHRASPDSLEFRLAASCLPLPCDQRYDEADMIDVVDAVLAGIGGN